MMRQQSCKAVLSLFACVHLAHTAHAYSAAEYQRARPLYPMLFRAFTFSLLLQIRVLYASVLSRWTPRYTDVEVLSSPVPFQVTFKCASVKRLTHLSTSVIRRSRPLFQHRAATNASHKYVRERVVRKRTTGAASQH